LNTLQAQAAGTGEEQRTEADFLSSLFRKLDENSVRYCVLHSWKSLPEVISSDLDIGVHSQDKQKLATTLADLEADGYLPVQNLNYFVNAYYIVFAWLRKGHTRFAALDIIFEHRRGGLIIPAGEVLVANRCREKGFWIPDPEVEFAYLLSKKTWKRSIPAQQAERLKWLVTCLETPHAERVAEQLFVRPLAKQVVDAIMGGTIQLLIPKLWWQTWRTSFGRHPFRAIRYVAEEAWRRLRRWIHPTGLFVVFAGPDGVGKSTVISRLKEVISAPFRCQQIFHWRPNVIWRNGRQDNSASPHGRPPRGPLMSVASLLVHFVDCWLGYVLRIRSMMARSTLVVFDRYFYDVQIDPLRFRFGGPMWLPRLLSRCVPRPDLLLVLDAPERVVLSRKQELSLQELQRQRSGFRGLAVQLSNTVAIDTSAGIESVTNTASCIILEFLARRLKQRTSSGGGRQFR